MSIVVRVHKIGKYKGDMVGFFNEAMAYEGDLLTLKSAQEFSNFNRKPYQGWMVVVSASEEEMAQLKEVCGKFPVAVDSKFNQTRGKPTKFDPTKGRPVENEPEGEREGDESDITQVQKVTGKAAAPASKRGKPAPTGDKDVLG